VTLRALLQRSVRSLGRIGIEPPDGGEGLWSGWEDASLACREDCGIPVIFEQKYEYTDFPVGTWKMYLIDGVLMVPSEY